MAIAGLAVVGRPFALWPATLQVMPGGVLDAGFGRFFVGVQVSNTSAQAWPPTEIRLSARGRQILAAAGIAVSDGLSPGDAAALGQAASGEWLAVPGLPAGGAHTIFLKLDVSAAAVGAHTLELEQRDPSAPHLMLSVLAPLFVARSSGSGTERVFRASCDRGTLTASVGAVSVDQESFRRTIGRARAIAGTPAPGVRTPAETERLRQRLRDVLCGEESDVCEVLADLGSSCALPPGLPPGPQPASGLGALSIFSTTATNLADRTRIADGSVGSNGPVTIGNDGIINGNISAGGDVQIGDRTRVQGNVTTAGVIRRTPTGGAVIAGAAKERVAVPPLTIATKTVSPGASDLTVANDATQTINPGNYKIVTLRARSKVTLSTGTYHMAQLVVEPDVTLTFNQPTGSLDVRVRDSLSFGDRVVIKAGASTAPGALAQFYANQSSEVRVGTDIVLFPVALTAPNGTIHVYSRTNVVGSLQGKTVTLEPDTGTARVPADDWLGTGSTGLELLAHATALSYSIAYKDGFFGTTGPLAFGALPWKVLLANALLQLDLGLAGSVGAELLAMAEKAVLGNVKAAVLNAPSSAPGTAPSPTQPGSVDAAVVKVSGKRALGYPLLQCLDAAPGEPNAAPVSAFGGTFTLSGQLLSNAELSAILAAASSDPEGLRVHKSGAGTGVTRGLLSALVPVTARTDATGTLHFINQLVIVPDPAAPAADGRVASPGDSGALWVQTRSNKLVGLTHTIGLPSGGAPGAAVVSRIEDVVNALQVQFA